MYLTERSSVTRAANRAHMDLPRFKFQGSRFSWVQGLAGFKVQGLEKLALQMKWQSAFFRRRSSNWCTQGENGFPILLNYLNSKQDCQKTRKRSSTPLRLRQPNTNTMPKVFPYGSIGSRHIHRRFIMPWGSYIRDWSLFQAHISSIWWILCASLNLCQEFVSS